MGYLYIKVIESKKVAVRSTFFVNYPFIRLRIGKEKKNTNFKPGVEWWDKIFCFQNVYANSEATLTAQARDKSIHVFGSDWLGELTIKLSDFMDGEVHQTWFRLGKGSKQHSRSPRGYIHLAFHYFENGPNGRRPFSAAPVEPVMAFEDWLACQEKSWSTENMNSFYSADPSGINPTPERRLRKSAPADARQSPERELDRKAHLASQKKSKSSNHVNETRSRSNTVPADSRKLARSDSEGSEDSKSESASSYDHKETVRTANLLDLDAFDVPKGSSTGRVGADLFNNESPVRFSPKTHSSAIGSSAASAGQAKPLNDPLDIFNKINNHPSFEDWYHPAKDNHVVSYNPQNPFLSLHESNAPAFSAQK